MDMTTYKLSKRGEVNDSSMETPFGDLDVQTTGNDGDLQMEKPGTGLTPEPEMMDKFETNIRDRFDLNNGNDLSPKGDSDADDY